MLREKGKAVLDFAPAPSDPEHFGLVEKRHANNFRGLENRSDMATQITALNPIKHHPGDAATLGKIGCRHPALDALHPDYLPQ